MVLKRLKQWKEDTFLANVYYDGFNAGVDRIAYTYQLQRESKDTLSLYLHIAIIRAAQAMQCKILTGLVRFMHVRFFLLSENIGRENSCLQQLMVQQP